MFCCVFQLLPKQDVLKRMSSLKTKRYRQPKPWCDPSQLAEAETCAVCLEPFNNNQVGRRPPPHYNTLFNSVRRE